ncbi:MAG: MBL fold metallo-hydrolase [Candidatus Binataceae bacterium]
MNPKLAEVCPGIYEIFLPLPARPSIVNVYLVDCGGAWALIDTGMNSAESFQVLEHALHEAGTRIEALDALIATHHHPDHFGASAEIQRRSRARIYIHELELECARRTLAYSRGQSADSSVWQAFFHANGFPIERYPDAMRPVWMDGGLYQPTLTPNAFIKDRDVIQIGHRSFEVIWTPGHSPGHNMLYLAREKILIAGDHLLPKITPHVGFHPGGAPNPLKDFLDSQRKMQGLEVDWVLPAHGGVFHDHRGRARELIEHHRRRESEMLEVIRREPMSAFEIANHVFGGERPVFHVMMATFETLAHLEYAHQQGRIRKSERGERVLYQSV